MAEQATQKSSPVIVINGDSRIKQYLITEKLEVAGEKPSLQNRAVKLMPGANRIEREDYEAIKKDIEFDTSRASARVRVMEKPITSMHADDAIDLVKMTVDRALLKGFASIDKREPVRVAIREQLEALPKEAVAIEEMN